MPYKDPLKQKEAHLAAQKRYKERALVEKVSTERVSLASVDTQNTGETPGVNQALKRRAETDPQWAHIEEFISRPTLKGQMSNLERLQRIAGSLGKYASEVRFGYYGSITLAKDSPAQMRCGGLTMEEIGKVIGILPPLQGKS